MAKSIYENPDEFRLVDVNSVILSEPNYLIIREPSGFGSVRMSLERKPEDKGGANFDYGDAESSFGFDNWLGGFQTIKSILAVAGSDASINLEYYNNGSLRFTGSLIGSSMDEVDDEVVFRLKRTDYDDKIRTRYEIDFPVQEALDLDGNVIGDFDYQEIPLHSQEIVRAGTQTVLNAERYEDDSVVPSLNLLPGLLWLPMAFNNYQKRLDNFFNYSPLFFFEEGSILSDQDRYVDSNPLEDSKIFTYEALVSKDVITIDIDYTFEVELDTKAVTGGGSVIDDTEIRQAAVDLWIVDGAGNFKELVDRMYDNTFNASYINPTINAQYSGTIELDLGDKLYLGMWINLGGTANSVNVRIHQREFQADEGYFTISSRSLAVSSNCKGGYIYDVLNRLIQKAIGTSFGEMRVELSGTSGAVSVGDALIGGSSGASAKIGGIEGGADYYLVDVVGNFETGEAVGNGVFAGILDKVIVGVVGTYADSDTHGQILKSSILERKENNGGDDGCGSLNFVTNGFAVRGFINDEYEEDKYYEEGDRVRYSGIDYKYISTINKGNLPTNAAYWTPLEGREVRTSIKKLIDFVKYRYGAGVAIVKEAGTDFGGEAENKITRVLIEKHADFFQDKKIMTLPNVENPVVRKVNKSILYNEIEVGYSIYSEEQGEDSLLGFNTIRGYVTPITRDKNKLSLVVDVATDGYEIERLRRTALGENRTNSDEKDEETFIIKVGRYNSDNHIKGEDRIEDATPLERDADNDTLIFSGLNLGDQIEAGADITIDGDGTYEVATISYDPATDQTTITTVESLGSGVTNIQYSVYFDTDVFLPERLDLFDDVEDESDIYTLYNLDHTPTNILIENFDWFGGGMRAKGAAKKIKLVNGVNNIFLEKSYESTDCFPTDSIIRENQDYTLSVIRGWNAEIFTDYLYEVACYMSGDEFKRLRDALINESAEDINFGWVDFINNEGDTIEAAPMVIKYDPASLRVELVCWERKQ